MTECNTTHTSRGECQSNIIGLSPCSCGDMHSICQLTIIKFGSARYLWGEVLSPRHVILPQSNIAHVLCVWSKPNKWRLSCKKYYLMWLLVDFIIIGKLIDLVVTDVMSEKGCRNMTLDVLPYITQKLSFIKLYLIYNNFQTKMFVLYTSGEL